MCDRGDFQPMDGNEFGVWIPDRGAWGFELAGCVSVSKFLPRRRGDFAKQKKKSRDPAKEPQVADNMTNACSARLLAGRARFTVCFRVAWGPGRSVKGRVEHALGEITTRDARRGLFAAASTLPSRVADGPTLDSSPRIAPRRGVGREERDGVGGGAQRVEFYFIFQTREAGCVARGPNRARCASR